MAETEVSVCLVKRVNKDSNDHQEQMVYADHLENQEPKEHLD